MFSQRKSFKYTRNSPDEKTNNHIDPILIDRRWHLSIMDVRSFRGPDCDTDHDRVVAKYKEILAVCKQEAQNSEGARWDHRKLIEMEFRKQYQTKISIRFAALENFNYSEDIDKALGNIKENNKPSAE